LDEESERLLAELQRESGQSVSAVLKRGLAALLDSLRERSASRPYDVYQSLELGPGGYARGRARDAKRALGDILRRKHRK
jgi:hypothetical protein